MVVTAGIFFRLAFHQLVLLWRYLGEPHCKGYYPPYLVVRVRGARFGHSRHLYSVLDDPEELGGSKLPDCIGEGRGGGVEFFCRICTGRPVAADAHIVIVLEPLPDERLSFEGGFLDPFRGFPHRAHFYRIEDPRRDFRVRHGRSYV